MKFKIIRTPADKVYVDTYTIDTHTGELVTAMLYSKREGSLRSATACINLGDTCTIHDTENMQEIGKQNEVASFTGKKQAYYVPIERIQLGKQTYYVACVARREVLAGQDGRFYISWTDKFQTLYDILMQRFTLPILHDWGKFLFQRLSNDGHLYELKTESAELDEGEEEIPYRSGFETYSITITEQELKGKVTEGLQDKEIIIYQETQNKLVFNGLDDYLAKYGHTVVENLLDKIKPLTGLISKVSCLFKKKQLFPKQAQLVNGLVAILKESSYAFLIAGMGCGKSFMSTATIDKFMQDKMDPQSTMSLSERTQKSALRAIYMVPGHLLKKTKREIEVEIPNAQVEIVTDFKQILALKKKPKRPTTKEFYIISKDFAKLEFQKRPMVEKWGRKRVRYVRCTSCGDTSVTLHEYHKHGKTCPQCNEDYLTIMDSGIIQEGWICPDCGELVYGSTRKLNLDPDDGNMTNPLGKLDFEGQKTGNSFCRNCSAELWTANIENLNLGSTFARWVKRRENPWLRLNFWRNKSKRGTKTIWVHKQFLQEFLFENQIIEGEYSFSRQQLSRKVSPASYIKKQLPKGFFDYGVFDEMHLYKGGGTAQGVAFHSLVKACKKRLLLTGTIMGGVAKDLFYILFRVDPKRMRDMGYEYKDVLRFCEDYGVIEEEYLYDSEDEYYNSSSRGRKLNEPQVKPGISPLLYAKFLFDKAVFMDLSDLAAFLPKFIEKTVRVDMTSALSEAYYDIAGTFRALLKDKGGKKLISTMLQTLLSYLDKPYGFSEVLHPDSGLPVVSIPDLPEDDIYPKERALVDIINQEYHEEGRMCVVYTTYTGEGEKDVTGRIKEVIESNCNLKDKVAILKSNTVSASEREDWLSLKTREGYKVIICNPKLVETGMDLLDHPTLIFLQTGYSLFTVWQSSRRSYRLNQDKECRVYYLAYKNTLQDECLKIMAEKKVATSAIQGKFSAEGLAAMAMGVDPQVQLAQSLSAGSNGNLDDKIEEMFAKINTANEIELSEEDKEFLEQLSNLKEEMKSLSEEEKAAEVESLFQLFDFMNSASKPVEETTENKEKVTTSIFSAFDFFTKSNTGKTEIKSKEDTHERDREKKAFPDFIFEVVKAEDIKKKKKKVIAGQNSLF